jgi:hypothetical protein
VRINEKGVLDGILRGIRLCIGIRQSNPTFRTFCSKLGVLSVTSIESDEAISSRDSALLFPSLNTNFARVYRRSGMLGATHDRCVSAILRVLAESLVSPNGIINRHSFHREFKQGTSGSVNFVSRTERRLPMKLRRSIKQFKRCFVTYGRILPLQGCFVAWTLEKCIKKLI